MVKKKRETKQDLYDRISELEAAREDGARLRKEIEELRKKLGEAAGQDDETTLTRRAAREQMDAWIARQGKPDETTLRDYELAMVQTFAEEVEVAKDAATQNQLKLEMAELMVGLQKLRMREGNGPEDLGTGGATGGGQDPFATEEDPNKGGVWDPDDDQSPDFYLSLPAPWNKVPPKDSA